MNYKVGDEVVCIDATRVQDDTGLKLGALYRISWIGKCCAGAPESVRVVEIPVVPVCLRCGKESGDYFAWRFIKLDKLTESSTEQLTEKV